MLEASSSSPIVRRMSVFGCGGKPLRNVCGAGRESVVRHHALTVYALWKNRNEQCRAILSRHCSLSLRHHPPMLGLLILSTFGSGKQD